jgi:hypothetical protein
VAQGLPSADVHVLTIAGAGHMNFSDLGVLWKFPPNQLGSIGTIAGARALALTRAYLSSFFTSVLTGQPSPVLTSPPPGFPEIHVVPGIST